jgi:hypothetical protein
MQGQYEPRSLPPSIVDFDSPHCHVVAAQDGGLNGMLLCPHPHARDRIEARAIEHGTAWPRSALCHQKRSAAGKRRVQAMGKNS